VVLKSKLVLYYEATMSVSTATVGNSPHKLRHPRYDAYSAQQVLLNKQ